MKDKKIVVVYGDGVHDDTEALQAFLDGTASVINIDDTPFDGGNDKTYKISKALFLGKEEGL